MKPRNRANSARKRQQKAVLLQRDGALCAWCGALKSPSDLTIDHVKPVSKGGRNALFNLCLACEDCNKAKGDRPAHERGWRGESA